MRKAAIDEENRRQIARQREFRIAADWIAEEWSQFTEIVSIAITGSVAKPLWKEVPRFASFRARGIELWHEFGQCPKGKRDCLIVGCGTIPFNKVIEDFSPDEDLLGSAVVLYRRGSGIVSRAVDLPGVRET